MRHPIVSQRAPSRAGAVRSAQRVEIASSRRSKRLTHVQYGTSALTPLDGSVGDCLTTYMKRRGAA